MVRSVLFLLLTTLPGGLAAASYPCTTARVCVVMGDADEVKCDPGPVPFDIAADAGGAPITMTDRATGEVKSFQPLGTSGEALLRGWREVDGTMPLQTVTLFTDGSVVVTSAGIFPTTPAVNPVAVTLVGHCTGVE